MGAAQTYASPRARVGDELCAIDGQRDESIGLDAMSSDSDQSLVARRNVSGSEPVIAPNKHRDLQRIAL